MLRRQTCEALDFASRRAVAEQDIAEVRNLNTHCLRPGGKRRVESDRHFSRRPADDRLKGLRQRLAARGTPVGDGGWVRGLQLSQRSEFAVSVDESRRNIKGQKPVQTFARKRSG